MTARAFENLKQFPKTIGQGRWCRDDSSTNCLSKLLARGRLKQRASSGVGDDELLGTAFVGGDGDGLANTVMNLH